MARVTDGFLAALKNTGLTVTSARDGSAVKGWLDSGNYALNWAMSGRLLRGYPLGHTVEIFGDPATGKSYLAGRALAMMQYMSGVTLLDDTEGAYSPESMERVGIKPEHLAYRRSRTVEEHLATTQSFITAFRDYSKQNKKVPGGLLVCDSLAQLSTKHEQEVKLDKPDMTKAKELKAFFRLVQGDLADLPVVHISTNHTIAAIGNMFQKRTTSGGGGPKFGASIRLDLRATSKIKVGDVYHGVIVRVVVDKNRIVAPWKEVKMVIPFFKPISRMSGLIELLSRWGILEARGQFLYHNGTKIGRAYSGKSNEHFLRQDEQAEQLLDLVPEVLEETDHRLGADSQLGMSDAPARAEAVSEVDDEDEDEE